VYIVGTGLGVYGYLVKWEGLSPGWAEMPGGVSSACSGGVGAGIYVREGNRRRRLHILGPRRWGLESSSRTKTSGKMSVARQRR